MCKQTSRSTGWCIGMIAIALTMLAGCAARQLQAAEEPEPRKIFAHYMGCFPAGTSATYHHARGIQHELRRDLLQREGWPGDVRRDYSYTPYDRRLTLHESVDLEMRRAMRMGVDGFAVDAWAGGEGAMNVLKAMFEVAEKNEYDFELTVCIDPMCAMHGDSPLPHTERTIKWLVDNYKDHPNLARRNGKPLIFGYQSRIPAQQYFWDVMWRGELEGYPSGPDMSARQVPREERHEKVRNAVRRLTSEDYTKAWELAAEVWGPYMERKVGHPLYIHFCLSNFQHWGDRRRNPENVENAIKALAKGVDAVSFFISRDDALNETVAKTIIEAGGEWGQPLILQYENYGTNTFWGSSGMNYVRHDWEQARKLNSTLIQYITWNDYNENTNLAPTWNMRYAYNDLQSYFIQWWKTDQEPEIERDKLYIFSRKYPPDVETWPFQSRRYVDGRIEIIAKLTQPGTLRVPGRGENGADAVWEAPAGMSHKRFAVTPGPVSVELIRDGETVLSLAHPEPVTDRPFRQHSGVTGISTECERLWHEDFGDDVPMFIYTEYADDDGDGLPNWFEMLYFGRFGDMSTATAADANTDSSGDGLTNLEAYLQRVHPVDLESIKK